MFFFLSLSFSSTEKCDEALVTPLPHNAFTSSSVFTSGYAPGYAKLNKRGGTVKHFHYTCSYTYSHPSMWIAEWTDLFFSRHYTSINTLELLFYDSNILQTSISQVLRLDIVLCHFNKHSCTIWHRSVITSITSGVNYWLTMAHPIMPNCAFGKHYVLRTNWAKIYNRCGNAVIYLGDMCIIHIFIIFILFLATH